MPQTHMEVCRSSLLGTSLYSFHIFVSANDVLQIFQQASVMWRLRFGLHHRDLLNLTLGVCNNSGHACHLAVLSTSGKQARCMRGLVGLCIACVGTLHCTAATPHMYSTEPQLLRNPRRTRGRLCLLVWQWMSHGRSVIERV